MDAIGDDCCTKSRLRSAPSPPSTSVPVAGTSLLVALASRCAIHWAQAGIPGGAAKSNFLAFGPGFSITLAGLEIFSGSLFLRRGAELGQWVTAQLQSA